MGRTKKEYEEDMKEFVDKTKDLRKELKEQVKDLSKDGIVDLVMTITAGYFIRGRYKLL